MSADVRAPRREKRRLTIVLAVLGGLAVLAAANAHLVYVAFISQPDCVTHLRAGHESAVGYRAARSSC